ncbi:hypothetical protein ACFWMJ_23410 [Streptomyces hawaiiensis]|uniref:hypothetical protein n=1 Tax=Streptomyces hawaiiensis TaxID=67305 RepID=UPI00364B4A27
MRFIVKYGDLIAVMAGGVAIGAGEVLGDVSPVWWGVWGSGVLAVAGARAYRRRLERQS